MLAVRVIAFVFLGITTVASARVTSITIAAVEPFAPGTTFGSAGEYQRVRGTFKGEVDPTDARNRVIANIDKAPRNAAGKVEYEADFFMLRPADAQRANGKLIYDVTNRGRLNFHWRFTEAKRRSNDPRTVEDAGDGLFFRQGYTFVWSGWDPEAPTRGNGLAMKAVVATDGGARITKLIREEFVSGTRDRSEGDGGSRYRRARLPAVLRSRKSRPEHGEAHGAANERESAAGDTGCRMGLRRQSRHSASAGGHATGTGVAL